MKAAQMSQILIRLEPELKQQISQLAISEGKNLSLLLRELMLSYIKEKDTSSYMSRLWKDISEEFKEIQVTGSDVEQAIQEERARNARRKT